MQWLAVYWPAVLLTLLVVWLLSTSGSLRKQPPLPYQKRDALVTGAELEFLHTLREAVDDEFQICAMVRLADLIEVARKTEQHQSWQNRIQAKHIDFVLCDLETMEALLAIELDDGSHQRADRVERDRFIEAALSAADLPLLRVPVSEDYCPDELREDIEEAVA